MAKGDLGTLSVMRSPDHDEWQLLRITGFLDETLSYAARGFLAYARTKCVLDPADRKLEVPEEIISELSAKGYVITAESGGSIVGIKIL